MSSPRPPTTDTRSSQGEDSSAEIVAGAGVGPYTIVDELEPGVLGSEYRVELSADPKTRGRLFFLPEQVEHNDSEAPFAIIHEARSANTVRDPGLLRMLRIGRHGKRMYFVEEDCAAPSLEAAADAGGLGPRRATRIAAGVADLLTVIHNAGQTHRDVRPGNILADGESVKLRGFGWVRAVEEFQHAKRGIPVANPYYASPEYYLDGRADARSDVYSLGAVYFHLLAGEPPYTADTSLQVLHKHASEPPADPWRVRPSLPTGCRDIVLRALSKDPKNRYASTAEMATALTALANVLPEDAAPIPPGSPAVGTKEASQRSLPLIRAKGSRSAATGWIVASLVAAVVAIAGVTVTMFAFRTERIEAGADAKVEKKTEPDTDPAVPTDPPVAPLPEWSEPSPDPVVAGTEPNPVAREYSELTQAAYSANSSGSKPALAAALGKLSAFAAKLSAAADARDREFGVQAKAIVDSLNREPTTPATTTPVVDPVPVPPVALITGPDLKPRLEQKLHATALYQLVYAPDGRSVFVRTGNGGMFLDPRDGRKLFETPSAPNVGMNPPTFSADGSTATWITYRQERTGNTYRSVGEVFVRRIDAPAGSAPRSFGLHTNGVRQTAISPDGRRLMALVNDAPAVGGTTGCDLNIWDTESGILGITKRPHDGMVMRLVVDPAFQRLATLGLTGAANRRRYELKLWSLDTLEEIEGLGVMPVGMQGIGFVDNGTKLAVIGSDGSVALHPMDGKPAQRWSIPMTKGGYNVVFSPDTSRLLIRNYGTDGTTIRVFDILSGLALLTPDWKPAAMGMAQFTADAKRVIIGGAVRDATGRFGPHTMRMWNVDTGAEFPVSGALAPVGGQVVLSADGRRVARTQTDGSVALWDIDSGNPTARLVCGTSPINVVFSGDGRELAVGTTDGRLLLFDLPRLAPLKSP